MIEVHVLETFVYLSNIDVVRVYRLPSICSAYTMKMLTMVHACWSKNKKI